MNVSIVPIPEDATIQRVVAEWSIREWGAEFPGDTTQTYIDLYEQSCRVGDAMPKVYVAIDSDGSSRVIGTVTLVADDELPNATEPGPWLAAMFVREDCRGSGVGRRLVSHCVDEAKRFGHRQLWLYTANHRAWYETLGWSFVRHADLHGTRVDVMTRILSS